MAHFASNHPEPSDDTLVGVYKPIVQAFSITLGIYYLLISGAHLAVLKGQLAWTMATIAAVSALIFLFMRFTFLRVVKSISGLENTMFGLSALAVINVTAHAHLASDPAQFVYLLMFAFGASMIGPTQRIVGATLLIVFCAAVFLTVTGPASNYLNNVFTAATAIGGGFSAAAFLHNSVRAQVAARRVGEQLLEQVALEGKRNKALAEAAEVANHTKADFLANMSHELRTPLNGVVGIAHALSATDLSATQREMVDLIENSGQMLTRLLSDILDFSKIEAGKIDIEHAPFNLREEINAAAFLLRSRAHEKGLSFDVTFSRTADGWLKGDVTRIKQVIANLTSNAVKFTQEGGVRVNIEWSPASEVLEIAVVDSGIGFDAEAGRNLFNRFVQADTSITRRFGGTGLGLSICRGLVNAMGGGIDWNSTPGAGSTFIVRLPVPVSAPPEVKAIAAETVDYDQSDLPLRILAAEDHLTNQKVLTMILEPLGVDLVICANGALALEAFKTQSFDVVLMDMQMPVMDGLAATKAIRAFEAQNGQAPTPIIMLTANAMRQHRDDANAAGANMHMTKPFTAAGLINAIENMLQNTDHFDESSGSQAA
jgi:signal transduction histidine kinase/ActR/RegA family two-component response regulator